MNVKNPLSLAAMCAAYVQGNLKVLGTRQRMVQVYILHIRDCSLSKKNLQRWHACRKSLHSLACIATCKV